MALGCVCPVTGSNPHTRQLKEKRRLDGLFNPSTRLSVQSNQLIKTLNVTVGANAPTGTC